MTGLTMTSEKFHELFGAPPRDSEGQVTQREMDLAASVQKVTEEIMLRMTRELSRSYGIRNLCLAGGVALNCVANGKILRDGHFDRIWIQPAAGDAGGALGAALAAHYLHLGNRRYVNGAMDAMHGSYLGPVFEQGDIERRLTASGARSILGDPRNPDMQKTLNLKIKYRESFRPFAPAVLREDVADYFELDEDSPYMLLVADVKRNRRRTLSEADEHLFGIEKLNLLRSDIPAVTHVDYSARIQTVHEETNPKFHALLTAFKERTGTSVLVNTSFNVRGEPIVCTPEDAFRCFMGTEMETLAVGNCLLRKDAQDPSLARDYKDKFELD
jgi:carbamoyltransferase